jgi:glycosyltransferase involved in cell wall biosynthesis
MGQKQGLDNLLDAAQRLRDQDVKIVISGDGNDRNRLVARAEALKLGNLSFIGLQSSGEFEGMLSAADVLITNQRSTVADMSLPSKLTSYFSAGRPMVVAASRASDTVHEVDAAKAAIVVEPDNPDQLAAAIVRLRTYPDLGADLGKNGRLYAERVLAKPGVFKAYDLFLEGLGG